MAAAPPRAGGSAAGSISRTGDIEDRGGLPDFETFLASKGSTIRVQASSNIDRQLSQHEDNEEDELQLESPPPTPPRKTIVSRRSNMRAAATNGREAALRDIEREMTLPEDDEESIRASEATSTSEAGHNSNLLHDDQARIATAGTITPPRSTSPSTPKADDGQSTGIDRRTTHRLSGSAPLPSFAGSDKALPMSPQDTLEHDLRRRSQYRTPGLATSPDLATLVKNARNGSALNANNIESPQPPPGFQYTSGPILGSDLPSSSQGYPSTSPAMTVRAASSSTRSRVSSDAGNRKNTPTLTTVSSLQAVIDSPRARAVSTPDSGVNGSSVHVNGKGPIGSRSTSTTIQSSNGGPQQVQMYPISSTELGLQPSTSSNGSAGRRSKKLTKNSDDKSMSNAMRKTSGFFKKAFGREASSSSSLNPSGQQQQYLNNISAPNTPNSARFSVYDSPNKPPVPSIPLAYAQSTPTRRMSMDRTPSSASASRTGRPMRADSSLSSSPSRPSPAKSLGRFSSFAASFRSNDNRSTSDLQSSVPSPPLTYAVVSGLKASSSAQSTSTEQERLARELDQWQGYEEGLEMLAPAFTQSDVASGDTSATSANTIRADVSRRSSGYPSLAQTPPPASTTRSRSSSLVGNGSILVSGSIPSPSTRQQSPRPSVTDSLFVSGSIPSPQQAQKKFRAASISRDGSGGSPSIQSSPQSSARRTHATRASSDMTEGGILSSLAATEEGFRLASQNGRQVRKRSPSASAENSPPNIGDGSSGRTPTVRLVNSPSRQGSTAGQEEIQDVLVAPLRKASIGLGLGLDDQQQVKAATSRSSPRIGEELKNSPARHNDIPRLITQSPSPYQLKAQGPTSGYASPTPARTASSLAGAALSSSRPSTSASISMKGSELDGKAKELAEKCWQEDESFLQKEKIAEWLGGHQPLNQAALIYYMQNFDFKDLKVELAFRRLCEKLYLRAETQQVDRIVAAFSARYIEQNPESIFHTKDVVHAVTYAMLLLNTDLHVADVASRMSRSDFILNTMSAIHSQNDNPPSAGVRTPASSSSPALNGTNGFFQADGSRGPSMDQWKDGTNTTRFRPKRSGSASANSSRTGLNDIINFGGSSTNLSSQSPAKSTTDTIEALPAANRPASQANYAGKAWEAEVELALRDIYTAVRSKAIMQPLAYSQLAPPSGNGSPYSSWSGSAVNRTPSRRSQASLGANDRSMASKRASIRGFLGASNDNLRPTSPTPSVGTSMSGGGYSANTSFGSTMTNATSYYPPTMGFASNLTHTIIREQQEDDAQSDKSDESTSDEELALLGAPWAKEGILQRKHYWEMPNKRSKDKHWLQVFAVISKGEMKMFQFGGPGAGMSSGGGVGGGNWLTNAHIVGEVPLAHSLSSAMPPPGYNRSRPHVLVLTLATGGSYFFQAGTEDLVNEWVLTCNYWAGRTSREPLLGGVSNMDYGWNKVATGLDAKQDDTEDLISVRSGRSGHSRRSRMSYAASIGRNGGIDNMADRATIFDWRPPQPPSGFSTLSEDAQYDSLRKHTLALETELEKHNEYRSAMLKLYSPRSVNAGKAAANWEKKAKYLLAEHVKYQTYVEALKVARKERQKRRDEKQVNRLLEEADDNAGLGDPNYVPDLDPSQENVNDVSNDTSIESIENRNTDEDQQGEEAVTSAGKTNLGRNGSRSHRLSATTIETTSADFHEATEGHTGQTPPSAGK